MGTKKILNSIVLLVFIILLTGNVVAITGSMGNARMILRANTGDKIVKYILVKNVPQNKVDVKIDLEPEGDLANDITIKDTGFVLKPGTEKKAYFIIDVRKSGVSETKINVKFTPVDGGNGIGLSSTVIVIAKGDNLPDLNKNSKTYNSDKKNSTNTNKENTVQKNSSELKGDASKVKITTKENLKKISGKFVDIKQSLGKTKIIAIGLAITAFVFLILLVLLVMLSKKELESPILDSSVKKIKEEVKKGSSDKTKPKKSVNKK